MASRKALANIVASRNMADHIARSHAKTQIQCQAEGRNHNRIEQLLEH